VSNVLYFWHFNEIQHGKVEIACIMMFEGSGF
jgi:hypothetical protein